MYPPHARGHGGEQALGFNQYRWEDGWACVRGPSGRGGHGVTAAGEDGLFYNVRTGILRIADNKAFAGTRDVGSATAIDPTDNLLQNLDDMISAVEGIGSSADVPIRQDVLRLLRQTRAAVRNGNPIPGRVQLVVHNEWGRPADVTARLKRLGIRLINTRTPVVPPAGADRPTPGLRTTPEVTPGSPPPAGGDVSETSFAGVLSETAAPKSPAATEIATGAGDVGSAALVAEASRLGAVTRVAVGLAIETLVFVLIGLGLAYLEERRNRELIKRRAHEGEARVQSAVSESVDVIQAIQNSVQRPTVWVNTVFRVDTSETTYSGGGFASEHTNLDDAALVGVAVTTSYLSDQRREAEKPTNAYEREISGTTTVAHVYYTSSSPIPYDPYSLDAAGRARRLEQNERDAMREDLPPNVVQALYNEHTALLRAMRGLNDVAATF
jgi:hypothetical protein